MTTQYIMTEEDRAKFERGAEKLKYMQRGQAFDDFWVPIGEGLLAVRRTVMHALRLTKARGGYYKEAFGQMCIRTPYADMDKSERSHLLYCMEHLATIIEMRAIWTPTDRARINHPHSMAKKLKEFLNRAPTEPLPRRNVSPMAIQREKIERLERTNLDLAEKVAALEAVDGSRFDLDRSNADEIATVIVSHLSTRSTGKKKAKLIADKILEKLNQRPSTPAG
jgi:hypothetical protein